MMDEFEKLYRQSPTVKLLYENSNLFPNKSMLSNGRFQMTTPTRTCSKQSTSLLEFEKPTVMLKKITPRTWNRYSRTEFLSPKMKFIQSMQEEIDDGEKFKPQTRVVKVLQRPDKRIDMSGDDNGLTIDHASSTDILENRQMVTDKTAKGVVKDEMINHQKSKDVLENTNNYPASKDNQCDKQPTNHSISSETPKINHRRNFASLSSNRKGVQVLYSKAMEATKNKLKAFPNFLENSKNNVLTSDKTISSPISTPDSVAKDLTSELISANMHDRAQTSPTSEELNKKYRMRKMKVDATRDSVEKGMEISDEKGRKMSGTVERRRNLSSIATDQCESDTEHENDYNGFSELPRNVFESSASETEDKGNKSHRRKNSSEQKGKVNDEGNKEDVTVTAEGRKAKIGTKKYNKSTIVLSNWSLRKVDNRQEIYVEGHRSGDPEGEFWHSSAIIKRVNARLLETGSGSRYRLKGNVDQQMSLEYGFSKPLVKKFQRGFPTEWKELIQEEFNSQSDGSHECKTPVESKEKRTAKTSVEFKNKIKTPVNNVTPLQLKDLRCSSRGRLIKPPLAYWTGQRLRSVTADAVEIVPGTSNLISASNSPNILALNEKIEVSNRDFRLMKRNFKKDSKKTNLKQKNNLSDLESASVDSDAGSVTLATDSDGISKEQSAQLKKLMKRNVTKSKSFIIDSESDKAEINEGESVESVESVKYKLRSHSDKKTHQSQTVLETRPVYSRTTVDGINNTKNNVKANARLNPSSTTGVNDAEESSCSDTSTSKPRRMSNRIKGIRFDSNSEADDEQSDLDQLKKTKKRASLRIKDPLSANSCVATPKETRSKRQEDCNRIKPPQSKEVLKRNNGQTNADKNTESKKQPVGITSVNTENDKNDKTSSNGKQKRTDRCLSVEDSQSSIWQPSEITKLQKALKAVDPSASGFWHRIATMVGTKTATECQNKYQAITEPAAVNKQKEVKKDKAPVMLTGKHGTMKRKRQLRQLVEQYDEDYEDDLFDMLSNKTSKKPKIPENMIIDEDEVFSSSCGKFQTPNVRPLTRIPMSTQKTPQLSLISPGMFQSVDRKRIDPYIHRLQGNKGHATRPTKVNEMKKKQYVKELQDCLNGHGTNIFDVKVLSDVDSDEEKDHYWSDEEFE